MDMSYLKGKLVNTAFPIDTDGTIDPNAQYGSVIGGAGPWQVTVRWDDGTTSVIHTEDVIFSD